MPSLKTLPLLLFLLSACTNSGKHSDFSRDNWSIFRGNPSLTAAIHVSLPSNPTLLWSFKTDSYTKSSPVVYHKTVYWSDRRGHIIGIDIKGEQVFDYALETAVDATPMIHDSVLYIGRIDGFLSAISLTKGDTLWNFETWGQIVASPNRCITDGRELIIVGSYDNFLYTIDIRNGKEVSRIESGYYINGAVAVHERHAAFGGCDGWFRVVDCISGIQTDSLDIGIYIPASPAMVKQSHPSGGIDCYIADHNGNVYEINMEGGRIVSHKKMVEADDNGGSFVSVPAVSEKTVYLVSGDRYLYAINRKDGAIAWKYLLKGDTGESSPVVCKDKVLICTRSGIITIHDSKTGNPLWEYDTGEQIIGSPAVIGGYFYILTFKGTLFCFGGV